MIFLNGKQIDLTSRFPDGTFSFHVAPNEAVNLYGEAHIDWYYKSEEEMPALFYLTRHLQQSHVVKRVSLFLPYCPNARLDRVHHDYEVFTLKYFSEFINMLGFTSVSVLDPHSSVTTALIDRCEILSPEPYIRRAIKEINDPELLLFYPDEGAMKRYADMVKMPYGFGIKRRHWETGKIVGLDIVCDPGQFKDRRVLIVDDICCRGGTFYHSAEALRKLGAKSVSVFCTHCEETIFSGDLLTTDLVDHIYTTNSIFRAEHEKISVFCA